MPRPRPPDLDAAVARILAAHPEVTGPGLRDFLRDVHPVSLSHAARLLRAARGPAVRAPVTSTIAQRRIVLPPDVYERLCTLSLPDDRDLADTIRRIAAAHVIA